MKAILALTAMLWISGSIVRASELEFRSHGSPNGTYKFTVSITEAHPERSKPSPITQGRAKIIAAGFMESVPAIKDMEWSKRPTVKLHRVSKHLKEFVYLVEFYQQPLPGKRALSGFCQFAGFKVVVTMDGRIPPHVIERVGVGEGGKKNGP